MQSLTGKTVLITGASRGIGFAIARTFAAENAQKVILVSRGEDALDRARQNILQISNAELLMSPGDVQNWTFWNEMRKVVDNVDILVNAAGVAHSSLLVSTSPNLVESVIQTNLMGTIWACRLLAKAMTRQRRNIENTGCIINLASLLGLKGGKGSVAYAASKAGVLGLTRSLAVELGSSNIRVNAIVPGYIETDMTKAMTTGAHSLALDSIPQKRFGTPDEVAHAALFLATNEYANNCVLNLDGGLSAT